LRYSLFRGPKFWILEIPGVTAPERGEYPGNIMQNFMPIGATIAEISATGHSEKTVNDIPF